MKPSNKGFFNAFCLATALALTALTGQADIVTTSADSGPGTLRQTIANAISGAAITFATNLSGSTVTLTNGQLLLNKNLTIDASALTNGISINGNGQSRIFEVASNTTVVLNSLTITNGSASEGGGIYNSGTLTVNRSTLSGNSSSFGGGAIASLGALASLAMNDCTVANNSAVFAGGIWSHGGAMVLTFCTISLNTGSGGSGGLVVENGPDTLLNTIVASNIGTSDPDIGGSGATLALSGINLVGQPASQYAGVTLPGLPNANGQLIGTTASPLDPQLAPLGYYGGPTPTMPPLPGSPAIDAGSDDVPSLVATDQRGFPRLVGANVDIGAVEDYWPVVVSQPQSISVSVGASPSFTVTASGAPSLAYQWQFNGTNLTDNGQITGSQNNVLTLTSVTIDNSGNYQVVVTNAYGSATSAVATLNVGTPPGIVTPPQSQAVAAGSNVTFNVTATGTDPLNYQWQLNDANVPGATNSTFNILNASVGNGGNYQVIVTNAFGSVTSSIAALAVYTPVTILSAPQSTQVAVGGSALFSVVALSSSPLTYQWFVDGAAIPGATNSSFDVVNAQLTDTGTYSVQVANLAGSVASASAALLVSPTLAPQVPASSYTIQIQAGMNLIANQLDNGGNTLNEILPVVPDGTAVSKFDNVHGSWTVNNYSAAQHAWVPSSITLNPGEGAFLTSPSSFSLTFTGMPHLPMLPVSIPEGSIWLLSRQTNDVGTYENIVGADPAPGAVVYKWNPTNASYIVFSYTLSGWLNGVEPVAAVGESMWIGPGGGAPTTIPTPPSISQQPVSVTVAQGGSASFMVVATGTEPLFYQWQLDGNGIPGETNSVLSIPNVQAINAGNYSVAVNNAIGISNSAIATLAISSFGSLPFADDFANAGTLGPSTNGNGTGSNLAATTEPGEPTNPDDIPIGATVWLSWQPPSGIANVTTIGSGYDTVLAVYSGSNLADLQLVAADDDSGPNLTSALAFNAVAGTTYYLQVGGFDGAMGSIVLSWNLMETVEQVPQIVTQPQSQTQTNGGPAVLSVVVTNIGVGVSYQWAFQGAALPAATNSTLTLTSLGPDQVGLYTVGVTNIQTLAGVLSVPASVEIFNPGLGQPGNFANVGPQDKFLNATALTPHDPNIPNDPTFAGGFTGTQIFSSMGASADQGEPDHCGYAPCHSVWYSYVPPTAGLLTIYTTNNFEAVLAVYTGPGNSFTNLEPVDCSATGTTNGETVKFSVTAGTNYWVVIDGINCAFGSYSISYTLAAPAAFTALPIGQTLTNGATLALTASTAGTPPFGYQWKFNGVKILGATNSSLVVSNFQAANQGNYDVVTKNGYGTNESAPAAVYLSNPPRFVSFGLLGGLASLQFAGAANSNYVFQTTTDMTVWVPLMTNSSPIGIINFYDPITPGVPNRFYRAKTQ